MIVAAALVMMSGGCCADRTNLVHSGHVAVENCCPGRVKILSSDAYDLGGLFVVKGILKRGDHAAMPAPVHVHVLVLSDTDRILQSIRSSTLYVPPKRPGHGTNWTRFEVQSDTVPGPGTRLVLVAHNHDQPHSDEDLLALLTSNSG